MQLVTILKVATIFEILVVSLLGFLIPVCFCSKSVIRSDYFRLLKSFSAGILFGVGLLHLFSDANADLSDIVDYPCKALYVV